MFVSCEPLRNVHVPSQFIHLGLIVYISKSYQINICSQSELANYPTRGKYIYVSVEHCLQE